MNKDVIYVILEGSYSDTMAWGYFDDEEMAKKFCQQHRNRGLHIEELHKFNTVNGEARYFVDFTVSAKLLDRKAPTNVKTVKDTWEPKLEPSKWIYANLNSIRVNESIRFGITLDPKTTKDKAEKIFYDYFAELLSLGNGEVTQEGIDALNAKFANYAEDTE